MLIYFLGICSVRVRHFLNPYLLMRTHTMDFGMALHSPCEYWLNYWFRFMYLYSSLFFHLVLIQYQ